MSEYRYARYHDHFVITRKSDGRNVFVHRQESTGQQPADYDLLWSLLDAAEASGSPGRVHGVLQNWFEDEFNSTNASPDEQYRVVWSDTETTGVYSEPMSLEDARTEKDFSWMRNLGFSEVRLMNNTEFLEWLAGEKESA